LFKSKPWILQKFRNWFDPIWIPKTKVVKKTVKRKKKNEKNKKKEKTVRTGQMGQPDHFGPKRPHRTGPLSGRSGP
jgi:hypothetical protein